MRTCLSISVLSPKISPYLYFSPNVPEFVFLPNFPFVTLSSIHWGAAGPAFYYPVSRGRCICRRDHTLWLSWLHCNAICRQRTLCDATQCIECSAIYEKDTNKQCNEIWWQQRAYFAQIATRWRSWKLLKKTLKYLCNFWTKLSLGKILFQKMFRIVWLLCLQNIFTVWDKFLGYQKFY